MKHLVLLFLLASLPASAHDVEDQFKDLFKELQLFGQNAGKLTEELLSELGPRLDELNRELQDWSIYEPPEVLGNGDIIIRRRKPSERPAPKSPTNSEDGVDL